MLAELPGFHRRCLPRCTMHGHGATHHTDCAVWVPPPLAEICSMLRRELQLGEEADMPTVVDAACDALGVSAEGSLLERVHACWRMLGAHGH